MLTVATITDDDGRRPDTTARSWTLIADHGDTMTIEVLDDTTAERVAAVERVLASKELVSDAELVAERDAIRREEREPVPSPTGDTPIRPT